MLKLVLRPLLAFPGARAIKLPSLSLSRSLSCLRAFSSSLLHLSFVVACLVLQVRTYTRAAAVDPQDPSVQYSLSLALDARGGAGDAEAAKDALDRALRLDPDSTAAHLHAGASHRIRANDAWACS